MNRAEVIEIGPVSTGSGIRRAHHQVMQLASDAGLFEINLHVSRGGNLLRPCIWIETDADQTIARQQPGTIGCGTAFDGFRYNALFGVDPLDAIPRR
jgi:hypothetical protein